MVTIAIPKTGTSLFRRYMNSKYTLSLRLAGARFRRIDLTDPDKAVAEALCCDGLLLPGGPDVAPALYGQTPSEKCGPADPLRDQAEPRLLQAFLSSGKPVLAICRGVQLMNAVLGGTLHQDIGDIAKCSHKDFRRKNRGNHFVSLVPGTRLAEIFGREQLRVNSLHHQAAQDVAPGLTVCAVSEDGILEGLEMPDHPFCIGVQWHPEHMAPFSSLQRRLFHAFVAACKTI